MGFDRCMPWIVLNLGGEMLYILAQRLEAQKIDKTKSSKVLRDVSTTMLGDEILREIFKPQKIYSFASTRQVFNRLAHSSIMRLSKGSMSKVLMCLQPEEIVQVTMNHLDFVKSLFGQADATCFRNSVEKLKELVQSMSHADFVNLRNSLLKYFTARNVKVGVFLSNGIQRRDGTFVTEKRAQEVPHLAKMPPSDLTDFGKRLSELGKNLFIRDEDKAGIGAEKASGSPSSSASTTPGGTAARTESDDAAEEAEEEGEGDADSDPASSELHVLMGLLGGVSEHKEGEGDAFSLDIFAAAGEEQEGEESEDQQEQRRDKLIVVEHAQRKKVDVDDFDDLLSAKPADAAAPEEDDLLSLMDSMS